jgi:hypothetical protein
MIVKHFKVAITKWWFDRGWGYHLLGQSPDSSPLDVVFPSWLCRKGLREESGG